MPLLHGEDTYERKLRPLYDAVDARSYKQAVKLADALLKKYKGDQLVRALKAYALHRSGKGEEALQLMREIVAEGPEAERVVMTMAYTYKAAGQLEGITQAYQAAAERLPRDQEVLDGLFRSYVREFNFVRQQQVAMRLSKLAPTGSPEGARCTWWIVCSLALQARAALLHQDQRGSPLLSTSLTTADHSGAAVPAAPAAGLSPDKLLQLAATMAARQVAAVPAVPLKAGGPASAASSSGKAPGAISYEALLLHLDLLQGQGKAAAALAALEGPLGAAVPLPADLLQLRAAAFVRCGDLAAAAACYRQALFAAPDDWLSWQLYLDCMLPGSGDGSGGPGRTGSTGGSRFPVGVVGGLADLWDLKQQQGQQQAEQGDQAAAVANAEAWAAVEECVCQLSAEVASNASWTAQLAAATLRAPHLWRCEVLLRRQRMAAAAGGAGEMSGHPATLAALPAGQEELAAAVGDAFAQLAANFSCVTDLRPYLAALSGHSANQLAARVHALVTDANSADSAAASDSAGSGTSSGNGTAAAGAAAVENGGSSGAANGAGSGSGGSGSGASGEIRRLQRLVNAHQLEAELGLPAFASPADAAAHAGRLLDIYRRHMHLSAMLDEKERGYGEELVAAAVGALMRAAQMEGGLEGRIARMLQALLVLEAAQQRRKVSAPLRLAATALYTLLGAPALACSQFEALDIKSIQHDSMTGHWLLPLLAGVLPTLGAAAGGGGAGEGQTDVRRRWVDSCAVLHELHQAEAGETLGTALHHGAYSKVAEFVEFKERLQHSHARALAAATQALLPPRNSNNNSTGGSGAAAAPQLSLFAVGTAGAQRAALEHARQLLVAAGAVADAGAGAGAAMSGAVIRFNEDLSTRPAWYPPASASSGAVADWWQQAQQAQQAQQQGETEGHPQQAQQGRHPLQQPQQAQQGYAHCWWAVPMAAESGRPEAAAWRKRCLAELRTRVAWALACPASLASASEAAALLDQLAPLLAPSMSARVASSATATSEAAAAAAETVAEAVVPPLQGFACGAVLALLQALVPEGAASQGAAAAGSQAASQLAAACCAAAQRAAAELAVVQSLPVLPGGALTTAAALASDCVAIAAVCGRLKKLAGKGRPEVAAAAGEAATAATAAAAVVKKAAAAALAAQDEQQRAEAAAAMVERALGGGEPLWGFEPALSVPRVLSALAGAQAAVLQAIK